MNVFLVLLRKDLLCLWRARQLLAATFGFAILLVVVASFSFLQVGYSGHDLKLLSPGVVWLVFLFAAVVGINHSFLIEKENEAILGLVLTPAAAETIYCAKALSNLVLLFLLQCVVLIVHGLLFGVDFSGVFFQLLLLTFLCCLGFVGVGTILSAIAVSTRGRELILPLVLFPVLLPLTAGAVHSTRELLLNGTLDYSDFWFVLILAYDVIAVTLSWVLFDYVLRE